MRYRILLIMLMSSVTSIQTMQLTRHSPSRKVMLTLIALALMAQQQNVEAPAVLIPSIRAMPDSLSYTISLAMQDYLMQSSHEQHFFHGDSALIAILKIIVMAVFTSTVVSCCFPP